MNISCNVLFYIKSNIFLNNFFFMTVPEEPDLNKLSRLLKRKMIWRYFTDLILVGNILDFKIRADLSNLCGKFSVKYKLFFNKNGKTINMWFCEDAFFFDFMQMSPLLKELHLNWWRFEISLHILIILPCIMSQNVSFKNVFVLPGHWRTKIMYVIWILLVKVIYCYLLLPLNNRLVGYMECLWYV